MDTLDWVAIFGALAWTPQIISWFHKWLTIPKVSLHLSPISQLSFTSYGPLFNVTFALICEKKDIILNDFIITLKHENGATHVFEWNGLSEDISEIENPGQLPVTIKKTYLPLVVRVLHTGVAQVFVRFRNKDFEDNIKVVAATLSDKYRHYISQGKLTTEAENEVFKSEKEFCDLMRTVTTEFIWQAGRYTMEIDFNSLSKFDYAKNKYTFQLNQNDINRLRVNISRIDLHILQCAKQALIPDFKPNDLAWSWIYPELKKEDE